MADPTAVHADPTEGGEPAPSSEPPILYDVDPPAAFITLNRPERRNAINGELVAGLHAALDRALDDDAVRAVILTGAGSSFCSGLDLVEVKGNEGFAYEEHLANADLLARLFRRLRTFEKVTIAAVNGPALASGCGMATLCDFTLSTGSGRFGFPEVRYGFVPAVVSVYMRGIVSEKRLREMLLTGRLFSADEANEIGLISEVVPADQLLQRGREIAAVIARNAPLSIQMTKELLETLPGMEIDRALKASVEYNARMRETQECHEGVTAFLEKREPGWIKPAAGDVKAERDGAEPDGAESSGASPGEG